MELDGGAPGSWWSSWWSPPTEEAARGEVEDFGGAPENDEIITGKVGEQELR